jgi:transcriptional regulator with XRE-family HTH domain
MVSHSYRQPHPSCARGQRLRGLRRVHGYTQDLFAELIAVTPRYLRRLEAGHRAVDSLRLLERIADALGMDLSALLDALDGRGSGAGERQEGQLGPPGLVGPSEGDRPTVA